MDRKKKDEKVCRTRGRSCPSSLSLTSTARPRSRTVQQPRTPSGSSGIFPSYNSNHEDCCSDVDSVKSFQSNFSTASTCDHANFALNGTTYSGRSRKFIVHCSNRNGCDGEEYLTPTQRAARQIRKFQVLLKEANKEIADKENEIKRLTKEVVELRLYKASLNSPEERTDSSDAPTVREFNTDVPGSPSKEQNNDDAGCVISTSSVSPRTPERRFPTQNSLSLLEPACSLVDSGHFEDSSIHSKDSLNIRPHEVSLKYSTRDLLSSPKRDDERKKIVSHYETRIEEMHRRHVDEIQSIKEVHNDKVEGLLNQISEVNNKYYETLPSLEKSDARIKELESAVEKLQAEIAEKRAIIAQQEETNKQMYLKVYAKGFEAAKYEQQEAQTSQDGSSKSNNKVDVAELLRQLTVSQAELENLKPFQDSSSSQELQPLAAGHSQSLLSVQEAVSLWVRGTRKVMYRRIVESRNSEKALDPDVTLQFLKSAVYYFLTDKDNFYRHLNAIESILGFTDTEKVNIDKIHGTPRK